LMISTNSVGSPSRHWKGSTRVLSNITSLVTNYILRMLNFNLPMFTYSVTTFLHMYMHLGSLTFPK
jgi:hypothetical protein